MKKYALFASDYGGYEMSEGIERLDLESENLVDNRLGQLKQLFPEVFSESGIDFDKLRLILGDEVDEGDERYAFTWPGKADAIRLSQMTTTSTLRPCIEKSRGRTGEDGSFDSDNIYIEGDNLEALRLLQRAYHGRVKLIYIDPPYNRGKDLVYKDTFGDTIENYREQTRQTNQSNPETSGRFHSRWCSNMYSRLKLARELLTDDGALVVSIGFQEVSNLTRILTEIFPDKQVMVVTVQTSGGKPSGGFNLLHEYLVFVVDEEFHANAIEAFGGNQRSPFEGLPLSTFNKIQRPNQAYPIFVDPQTMSITGVGRSLMERIESGEYGGTKGSFTYDYTEAPAGQVALWPYTSKGKECVWRLIPERLMDDWEDGFIKVSKNTFDDCPNEYSIQYLPEGVINKVKSGDLVTVGREANGKTRIFGENTTTGAQIPSIWENKEYYTAKGTAQLKELFGVNVQPFDYPKPLSLISDIVGLLSSDDDIVMDFFSGSATTAHACFLRNFIDGGSRKWILVQLPEVTATDSPAREQGYETICAAGEQRIRLAGNAILREVAKANKQLRLGETSKHIPDIGFRVLELDSSGFIRPKDGQLLIDRIKPDRTDFDIIFEAMLKWGYELTYPIEEAKFVGYECYSVAAGDLICCMQPGLTTDALEAIAASHPRRVLMLDSAIDDTTKLNALAIFRRVEEQTQQKIELRTV